MSRTASDRQAAGRHRSIVTGPSLAMVPLYRSKEKMRFQSFFMLITVQPLLTASS